MTDETNVAEAPNEEVMPVDGDADIVETPESTKQWSSDDEEKARFLGWKDPSEWQGDHPPQGLIDDPRKYVERAESILPFRKLQEQYTGLEGSIEKIHRIYEKQIAKEREETAARIKQAQQVQRDAVETGDTELWERARRTEDHLRSQAQPQEPQQTQIAPEVVSAIDEWRVDNPWFGQDPEAGHDPEKTQQAAKLWADAERQGIRTPKAILKFIDKQMAPPEPQRQRAAVEGGLSLGGNVEPFSKLPKEAKEAFKRMVKQGLFEDSKEGRAAYQKDYNDV